MSTFPLNSSDILYPGLRMLNTSLVEQKGLALRGSIKSQYGDSKTQYYTPVINESNHQHQVPIFLSTDKNYALDSYNELFMYDSSQGQIRIIRTDKNTYYAANRVVFPSIPGGTEKNSKYYIEYTHKFISPDNDRADLSFTLLQTIVIKDVANSIDYTVPAGTTVRKYFQSTDYGTVNRWNLQFGDVITIQHNANWVGQQGESHSKLTIPPLFLTRNVTHTISAGTYSYDTLFSKLASALSSNTEYYVKSYEPGKSSPGNWPCIFSYYGSGSYGLSRMKIIYKQSGAGIYFSGVNIANSSYPTQKYFNDFLKMWPSDSNSVPYITDSTNAAVNFSQSSYSGTSNFVRFDYDIDFEKVT